MIRFIALVLALASAALCLPQWQAQAHEFWIEPVEWQVPAGAPVAATFRNGELFAGSTFSFLPMRSERFDVIGGGEAGPAPARLGDNPALQLPETPDGLLVVVHETADATLTYRPKGERSGWERFTGFLDHKAADGVAEAHLERGLPREGVVERYRRFAKALIGVGDAEGSDAETAMRTEIVALANPYADDVSGGLPVRVLLESAPRAGAQVELFERAPDGTVAVTLHPTDADGVAVLPVRPGHAYLADSVALLPLDPAEAGGAMWESLWAALTFAVPEA